MKFAIYLSALFVILFLLVSAIFPSENFINSILYPKQPSSAQAPPTLTGTTTLFPVDSFGVASMQNSATEQDFTNMGMTWFYDYGMNLDTYFKTPNIQSDIVNNKYHYVPMISVGSGFLSKYLASNSPNLAQCTPGSPSFNVNLTNPMNTTTDFDKYCLTDMTKLQNSILYIANQLGSKNTHYYIVGNEPNVPGQGDSASTAPSLFARQYADIVKAITYVEETTNKNFNNYYIVGPSMLSWNGTDWKNNINYSSPWSGRLWFNSFLKFYQTQSHSWPRIDRLNIHLYNLGAIVSSPNGGSTYSADPLSLENQLTDLYNWAQNNNIGINTLTPPNPAGTTYKNTPIWITEFGIAHCNPVTWGRTCASNTDPWVIENAKHLLNGEDFADLNLPKGRTGLVPFFIQNKLNYNLERWFLYAAFGATAGNVYPINIFTTNNPVSHPWPLTTIGQYYKTTFITNPPQLFTLASGYSGQQGVNNWYYYYVKDLTGRGPIALPLSYVPGPEIWYGIPSGSPYWNTNDSKYLMISPQNMIPENHQYPVLYWKAPSNGTVTLTVNDTKVDFNAGGTCKGNGYIIGVGTSNAPGYWYRNLPSEQTVSCGDHSQHTLTTTVALTQGQVVYVYKSDVFGNSAFGNGAKDIVNIYFTPR